MQNKDTIIIGKVWADWCGHCDHLKPEWKKMKNMAKLNLGRTVKNVSVDFVEIGDVEKNRNMGKTMEMVMDEYNNKNKDEMNGQIVANGFPTIFKICNKKIEYYNGERVASKIYEWGLSCKGQMGGKRKTNKRRSKVRKTKRVWFF